MLLDAFQVRTVLVPSLMHLLGKANWYLPGWLDRMLPKVSYRGCRLDARGPDKARVHA